MSERLYSNPVMSMSSTSFPSPVELLELDLEAVGVGVELVAGEVVVALVDVLLDAEGLLDRLLLGYITAKTCHNAVSIPVGNLVPDLLARGLGELDHLSARRRHGGGTLGVVEAEAIPPRNAVE